ncbi:PAS domain-containing protein [Bacillus suaedaesalsae]|uniref:PAS domain-containing protein n=1 Tax=Bacillus suaedaesalsae TaxID=2810349 RepID=A0ABS2DIR4_9BACI|nr:PAS domain-containing protein [Bacillus suaedaesalsae]MBM6617398.1 PAS domain-containing protein [Bacillus suaedaesalsae]
MQIEDPLSVLEHMPTGVMVLDTKGSIAYINESGKAILGVFANDDLHHLLSRFLSHQETKIK